MQLSHYSNWNYLSCKAIKIMIKTQMLLWKSIEGNRSLRVRLSVWVKFLLFYSELVILTCDATCSRLYLDRKIWGGSVRWTPSIDQGNIADYFPVPSCSWAGFFIFYFYFYLFIYSPDTHIMNINIRSYIQKRQGWLYI